MTTDKETTPAMADLDLIAPSPQVAEGISAELRARAAKLKFFDHTTLDLMERAAAEIDRLAASRRAGGDLRNEIEMVSGALELCEPEEQAAFKLIVQNLNGGKNG